MDQAHPQCNSIQVLQETGPFVVCLFVCLGFFLAMDLTEFLFMLQTTSISQFVLCYLLSRDKISLSSLPPSLCPFWFYVNFS